MRIDNIKELAVVARALRLHHLMNKLGNGCLSGDVHDGASVEHMAAVAKDDLRQEIARRAAHIEDFISEEELLEWYLGNVDYAALEWAIHERCSGDLFEDLCDDISDKVSRGHLCYQDVAELADKAIEAEKEWLRTDEGKEWINE